MQKNTRRVVLQLFVPLQKVDPIPFWKFHKQYVIMEEMEDENYLPLEGASFLSSFQWATNKHVSIFFQIWRCVTYKLFNRILYCNKYIN